jgi:hypothetical protein
MSKKNLIVWEELGIMELRRYHYVH